MDSPKHRRVVEKEDCCELLADAEQEMRSRLRRKTADRDAQFRPILVMIEEAADVLTATAGKTPEAKADQELTAKIQAHVLAIGRLGRSARVHLVIAPQRPDAALFGPGLRSQLGYRVLMLSNARDDIVEMVLEIGRNSELPGREPPVRIRDIPVAPGRAVVEAGGDLVIAQIAPAPPR